MGACFCEKNEEEETFRGKVRVHRNSPTTTNSVCGPENVTCTAHVHVHDEKAQEYFGEL